MAWTSDKIEGPRGTRYKVRWRDPFERDKRGEFKIKSKTFARYKDARDWERQVETDKDRGEYQDPKLRRVTFAEYWPRFLDADDRRPSTRNLYQGLAAKYLLPAFGPVPLPAIGPDEIGARITDLKRREKGAATIAAAYRVLRAVLNHALRARMISWNPTMAIKPPKPGTEEMRFLSAEEVERLAAAVPDEHRALVYFLAYGGLRIGEAAALRVENLNLLRARAEVVASLSEVNGRVHIGPTKTGAKRVVSLPKTLVDMLAAHVGAHASREGYVFPSPGGGPLRPGNFRSRVFAPAVRAAGLAPLRIHDLRHTAAALAIASGAHPKEIQDRLGHSSISVTLDRYGHLMPALDERLSERLEDALQAAQASGGTYPVPDSASGQVVAAGGFGENRP